MRARTFRMRTCAATATASHFVVTRILRARNDPAVVSPSHNLELMNCLPVLRTAACAAFCSAAAVLPLAGQGASRKVALKFQPMVGVEKFACGQSYAGVGTSKATLTPSDFAIYVHDVKLLKADGSEVPVTLDQDGVFQNGTVALLDFEDGTGPCSNGNAATHMAVEGTVPQGKYTGVRFTVGVPFERNHLDLATQPSPLSVTRMFWAWNTGHKFARFDAKSSEGKSWVLHLGSTGCTPTGSAVAAPTTCAQENRVTITMAQFDVDADAVMADAGTLFAGNGGAANQVCMSSPKSPACAPMFASMGIPFNGQTQPQTFFRKSGTAVSLQGADK
jgi:uncharacterized repeat protein (TIGR04052 family)